LHEPHQDPDTTQPINPDWRLLLQFAARNEVVDRLLLRGLLATALVRRGHTTVVVENELPWATAQESRAATVIALLVIWTYGAAAALALDLHWYLWPVAFLLVFLVLGRLGQSGAAAFGVVLLVGWFLIAFLEAQAGIGPLAVTHLVPGTMAVIYGVASRALRLRDAQDIALAVGGVVRGAPLIAPVVLLVLFLPALSADVWQVADGLTLSGFVLTGLLSVGLLLVLLRRQLGQELPAVLNQRSTALSDAANRSDLMRIQAGRTLGGDEASLVDAMTDETLDDAWPTAGEEYTSYLAAAEGDLLQRPLTARLAITVLVVGALVSAYIYFLCAAVVPTDVVANWTHGSVGGTDIRALGTSVHLPCGPYPSLAVLLGIAATATFLSFAIVEERFAAAMTDALLRAPADGFLSLALPYVRLREEAILTEIQEPSAGSSSAGRGSESN
jgi:hypothetical protein